MAELPNLANQRDTSLDPFHAIGKLLYGKRVEEGSEEVSVLDWESYVCTAHAKAEATSACACLFGKASLHARDACSSILQPSRGRRPRCNPLRSSCGSLGPCNAVVLRLRGTVKAHCQRRWQSGVRYIPLNLQALNIKATNGPVHPTLRKRRR